jgi:pseudaminic acid synthase
MKINGRPIDANHRPYIVAEMSSNHGGNLENALELITTAKLAGADAVKFQAYRADKLVLNIDRPEFSLKRGPWKGQTLYDLYKESETPIEWWKELFDHAAKQKITCFASVFDHESIDYLEELGCPAYKIASFEIVDLPLIRHAASKGKPIIISTGMASGKEVFDAAMAASQAIKPGLEGHPGSPLSFASFENVALLHCVSAYPTKVDDSNLCRLDSMRPASVIGISDHSEDSDVPIAATALGACIIEKHLRLDYWIKSADDFFSMLPHQFAEMVFKVHRIWLACQKTEYSVPGEEDSVHLRRSLYVVQDIAQGELFSAENVRSIRPNLGLPPKDLPNVIGKTATEALARGTPLSWKVIK